MCVWRPEQQLHVTAPSEPFSLLCSMTWLFSFIVRLSVRSVRALSITNPSLAASHLASCGTSAFYILQTSFHSPFPSIAYAAFSLLKE